MTKPTCSTCAAYHRIDDTCHQNPPQVSIVLVPDLATESFKPSTFCAFPTTNKNEWCRQHEETSRILTPTNH
jgi:hypothetical protein